MLNVDGIALVNNAQPHPKRKKVSTIFNNRSVQQRLAEEFDAQYVKT